MFENPRRGRQARNFGKNVPKILDLKSSSEHIFQKLSLGAPVCSIYSDAVRILLSTILVANNASPSLLVMLTHFDSKHLFIFFCVCLFYHAIHHL